MKRLTPAQTRRIISQIGMERSLMDSFGFTDAGLRQRYDFHRHKKHQLLSPQTGVLLVETNDALHTVSPFQAAWIPAGVRHATTIGGAPAYSLFFPPANYSSPSGELRVVSTDPLTRELLVAGATGWKAPRAILRSLFDLLHYRCLQAMKSDQTPNLPRPRSPGLIKGVEWLLQNLDSASPGQIARHAAVSERTLRRHFQNELGLTAERYIQQARMIKAMQLLTEHAGPAQTITEVALSVGYQNHSAFSASFRESIGQTPSQYRAKTKDS